MCCLQMWNELYYGQLFHAPQVDGIFYMACCKKHEF